MHTALVRFTWNDAKAASNLAKHGVAFEQAEILDWTNARVKADTRHDYGEVRLTALAHIADRVFHVTFTIRRNTIWIISLRRASDREISRYENEV